MSVEKAIQEASHKKTDKSTEEQDNLKARAGRPRSEKARKAIIDATKRLLTHMSLSDLSIEAIAKKAKVGKTTIYRWWPNKAAVAMEAFLEQPGIQMVMPTTATAAESIMHQLDGLIRQLRGQNGRIIAGIIAEGQADQAIADMLYEKYLKNRIERLYKSLEAGKSTGEFRNDLDSDIVIDMLIGPLFLRVLSGEDAMNAQFVEDYPKQAILALKA